MTFREATAVRPADDAGAGRYVGTVPEGWDIVGATNGGYLMALATAAVRAELQAGDPVSVTTHYFAPVSAGPVQIEVTPLRRGNRFATASALLRRGDGCLALASLATVAAGLDENGERSDAESAGPRLVTATPPELPAPQECVLVEPTQTFPQPFMGQVEVRLPPSQAQYVVGKPTGRAEMAGWFALRGDEPMSADALMVAADAFPPTVFNAALPVAWTPTVELTVQVRARPRGGNLRCTFVSRYVADGFLEVDGEIWDSDDRLLALSRQLALIPRA
jgi:acyl-CoA thioesterase